MVIKSNTSGITCFLDIFLSLRHNPLFFREGGILFPLYILFREFFFYCRLESGETPIPQQSSIDENSRDPPHPNVFPFPYIVFHHRFYLWGFHVLLPPYRIQTYLLGDFSNFLLVQVIVIFVKFVVKFPKLTLPVSCQGRQSSLPGKCVIWQGEVFNGQFDHLRVCLKHLFE